MSAVVLAVMALMVLLAPQRALAADPKVEFSAAFSPAEARAGEHVVLEIDATVPEGFHLYSLTKVPDGPIQLKLPLEDAALEAVSEWHAPTPHVEVDPNFNKAVEFYDGTVSHTRAFKIVGTEAGPHPVEMTIRGQICDEHKCLSFKEVVNIDLELAEGDARSEHTAVPKLEGEAFPADRAPPAGDGADAGSGDGAAADGKPPMGESIWSFIGIAFLAGLAGLATPCVFPMIPITIGFFSKFSKVSTRRSLLMAGIYCLSIIGTFTLVGMLISAVFGAAGMQTISTSLAFNIFIALLLIVFAFNLFGLFEIQVPSFLIAKTSKKEHELKREGGVGKQALGVFFMGLTFTLISFTCTVGFIGVIVAQAADGEWFYPGLGMFVFSLAFALPFFFLAVFPSVADKLKGKAGDWMVSVKVVLGFLELAGAFKFLSNIDLYFFWGIITRPFVLAFWTAIFFVAGLYLLKVVRLGDDHEPRAIGPIRMFFGICMLMLAVYSSTGIRDTKSMGGWIDGWLPPAVYPGQEVAAGGDGEAISAHELAWRKDDIPGGIEQGKRENKPVFVDFTGYQCTNCRYMEASVFPLPDVMANLEKTALVTAYTDCPDDICEQQRDYQVERFETAALPFYAMINPHNDEVLASFASSTNEPAEFVAFLEEGHRKFDAVKPKDLPKPEEAADGEEGPVDSAEGSEEEGPGEFADVSIELAAEGEPVDFTFPGLESGEEFTLSSLRENWVFVNYWASWCAPCKKELKGDFPPAFAEASHIKLVTVAFDGDETKEQSIKFAKEIDLFEHPTLQGGEDIEEAGLPESIMGGATLPQSYLIAPDGHVAWSHVGSVDKPLLDRLFAQTK